MHAPYTSMDLVSFILLCLSHFVLNKAMALKPEHIQSHLYVQNKERHLSQQFQRVKVESLGFGSQRNSVSKHFLCRLKLCTLFERLSQFSSVFSDVTSGPYQNDVTPNSIRQDLRGKALIITAFADICMPFLLWWKSNWTYRLLK